jgi:hypothetical protein
MIALPAASLDFGPATPGAPTPTPVKNGKESGQTLARQSAREGNLSEKIFQSASNPVSRRWPPEATSPKPRPVQLWMRWLNIVFLLGLFFASRQDSARWALVAYAAA